MDIIDLTGKRFGFLTVLHQEGVHKYGSIMWRCRCDCGKEVLRKSANLKDTEKKNRRSSCGCHKGGRKPVHGMTGTFEHRCWQGMIRRCHSKTHHKYPLYGGRGIRVCKEWRNDFMAFFNHIGPRPGPGYTVDRKDPNKGYEPGNVRWATSLEQRHNRRR